MGGKRGLKLTQENETKPEYIPKSAMAIFAHPDDIEFSCAGTVARWVKAGARVAYILVTSGDVGVARDGVAKEGLTRAEAAEIREAETRAAAEVVGVHDVTFFRVPDGMVENNLVLRKRIVRELRRFRPEVVITGDPTLLFTSNGGVNHPDHRAVGGAAIDAVFPASGQPHFFEELAEEGLFAHKVRKIYVASRGEGSEFVDITDTMDLKIEALLKHDSQVGHLPDLPKYLRERSAKGAEGTDYEYAEIFRLVTVESDEKWAELRAAHPELYQ